MPTLLDTSVLLRVRDQDSHELARWRNLVTTTTSRGRPAHDARLFAVMEAFNIVNLITLNAEHFRRFDWVHCYTPAVAMQPPWA